MKSASLVANQLDEYIRNGRVVIAGNEITIDQPRLAAWRMVLDRTIPTLSSTEITHKSGLEGMDTGKLVSRLAELVRVRPELAERLQEALGHRIINPEPLTSKLKPET